jgi:hypothetical protein
MTTKTEAVKAFLLAHAPRDLANLYDEAMELQVNVVPSGEPVEGDHDGVKWRGWTDGLHTWKPFRIPWGNGNFEDGPLSFDLAEKAEAIGMTGWDWQAQVSRWVGFDFDSLVGHQKGLTEDELAGIVDAVSNVDWVTVRRSRSGRGLHLYVFLDPPIETSSREEHAALARAVLNLLSAHSGMNLQASVDKLGCVLWVWHRVVKAGGLALIKAGRPLDRVPDNWRSHLPVVQGRSTRASGVGGDVDDLVGLTRQVPLDAEHRRLLQWFTAQGDAVLWWWDGDRHMLVCHTADLKRAHQELACKGVFYTNATGKEAGRDQNCFAFPLRNGAWTVRRHGQNTLEHPSWQRDAHGWTKTVFNKPAELRAVAAAHGGIENSHGEFVFKTGLKAIAALRDLGASGVPELPPGMTFRPARLEPHDTGRLLFDIDRETKDPGLEGWLPNKKGDRWEVLVNLQVEVSEGDPPDDVVRHVVSNGADAGWFVRARGGWIAEPRQNVMALLTSTGVKRADMEPLLGHAISNYWELVNLPFQPEYPGNRRWNKYGARLALVPQEGPHPTWDAVLNHVGHNLNREIRETAWCKDAGIVSGYDYLLYWIAAMIQEPLEPLPYLFLYGPQKSGKSILHEALSCLFTSGYVRADTALTNPGRFNGELAGAVLCVVEETNLRTHKGAYDRIKDWATGKTISIHIKNRTPYDLPNSCKWVQCANAADHCPILPGDTRITMIWVAPLAEGAEVPKRELLALLKAEAPAFLHTLMHLELPPPIDRLRLPVIDTPDKMDQMEANRTELETFITEHLVPINGSVIKFDEFYERFMEFLTPNQRPFWSKRRVGREWPTAVPKGRYAGGGHIHIGNVAWDSSCQPGKKLTVQGDRLVAV